MPRRLLFSILSALTIAVLIATFLVRRAQEDLSPARMAGDATEQLADVPQEDLPDRARAFLASDRPWRASRAMRRYRELGGDLPPDLRLLAARAEAGWGAWPAVLELLRDAPALDAHSDGLGLYLLARALDDAGASGEAATGYEQFLALAPAAGELDAERAAARLRLGLVLVRDGRRGEAQPHLAAASSQAGEAAVWIALLEADALAAAGDTAAVRDAVAGHEDGLPGLRAWRARILGARAAGDVARARALANEARAWASTDQTRAEFFVAAARAAIDMGDVAAGRDALRAAIDLSAAGPYAREAAELLAGDDIPPADALAVARVHSAQGLFEEALPLYEQWLASDIGTPSARGDVLLEFANALFYAGEYRRAIAALRPIASERPARMMIARAEEHRDNFDEAVAIYLSIPGSNTLFLAASARHDEGDLDAARELYRRVVAQYPGTDRMGLAMMRLAGIAFEEGDYTGAARIWGEYRTRYPRGSRTLQATYWQGRALEEAGDAAAAAALFRAVRESDRDSYYALVAGRRIDEPFWPLPMSTTPEPDAAAAPRVAGWMGGVDLLRAAGFEEEASAEADRVVSRAGADRPTRYALAEALIERGYSQRAIRIGLGLETDAPPDRRLLRILFPFPYRTLITEEARDRELDPFVASALIRQESMFEARITSHVGARGLMQIMPATGIELAAAAEVEPWDAELLYHPEINVHLGTRLLARHMQNYEGSLPSVFSAYNAGPHRVEWWSAFPEYDRDELFTERIPYAETRNYVRILTRNIALYSGLYGGESDGS